MRSSQHICKYLLTSLLLLLPCASTIAADSTDPNNLQALIEAGGKYVGLQACRQCHDSQHVQITQESHGQAADARTPFAMNGCESCHGPGEKHIINYAAAGDKDPATIESGLIAYAGAKAAPVEVQNAICMECHQGGAMINWHDSLHEIEEVPCTACHSMHRPDLSMDRETEAEACYACHNDIRAQTYQKSTHAIREGKVVCSDCHNSHGSNGPAMLTQLSINDNCYECHAEKRGPYLWEHYPVTEDCSLCHRSHGSMHNFLLIKQGTNLCQQCHAQIGPDGTGHIRTYYDAWDNDPKRGRSFLGRNCANCHKVHGSNHPSGPNLLR